MGGLEHPMLDKYDRDYMYGSITLINLYEKKYKELLNHFYENEFDQD